MNQVGISNVVYVSSGDKAFPKERMEVFGGGRVAVLDDYRRVTLSKGGQAVTKKMSKQDKGHRDEIVAFAKAISSGQPAIPWDELSSVTLASILAGSKYPRGMPVQSVTVLATS